MESDAGASNPEQSTAAAMGMNADSANRIENQPAPPAEGPDADSKNDQTDPDADLIQYKLHTLLSVIDILQGASKSNESDVKKFLKEREDDEISKRSALRRLNADFRATNKNDSVKVIIVFDEAHTLKDLTPITSLFHTIYYSPIFIVYLATTSSLNILAPASKDSTRLLNKNLHLNLAYVECRMRLFAKEVWNKQIPKPYFLDTFCKLTTAASLGRPLWSAMVENKLSHKLLQIVSTKLLRSEILDDKTQQVALSARLLLRTQESSAGLEMATSFVSSHLAVAYFVSRDRQTVHIAYPPEPLVAAAATEHMLSGKLHSAYTHDVPAARRNALVTKLIAMLDGQQINRGYFGELVGRLYYLLARDAGFGCDYPQYPLPNVPSPDPWQKVPYLQPVSLLSFMKHIVGDHFTAISRCDSGVDRRPTFKAYFETAAVHFVSWCRADPRVDLLTVDSARRALAQGTAVQCAHSNEGFDHVIYFVLDPSKPLDKMNIGFIVIEIKNCKNARAIPIHPKLPHTTNPIIFIAHELAQEKFKADIALKRSSLAAYNTRHPKDNLTPLFEILLHGVNSDLIRQEDCTRLLQSQTMYEQYKNAWQGASVEFQSRGHAILDSGLQWSGMEQACYANEIVPFQEESSTSHFESTDMQ